MTIFFRQVFCPRIMFIAIAIFLLAMIATVSSSFPTDKDVKRDAATGKNTVSNEESLLLAVKNNPKDFNALSELGYHYFFLAHDHEAKYLWGNPPKEKLHKEKTEEYADKAIDHLKRALEINPNDATALTQLANSYGMKMRVGGLGAKMSYLKHFRGNLNKALDIDPKNTTARISEAFRVLYTPSIVANRTQKARAQFEELLKEDPGNHEVIKGLAIINQREDNFEKAHELIEKVLNIEPNDLEALSLKREIKDSLEKNQKKKK